jgi:hypothetical protein
MESIAEDVKAFNQASARAVADLQDATGRLLGDFTRKTGFTVTGIQVRIVGERSPAYVVDVDFETTGECHDHRGMRSERNRQH